MFKCTICAPPKGDGTPERQAEVDSLLGAGETHRETARISGCSLSTVTRHAKHSKAAISAYAAGGTPEQIAQRKAWLEILELARQRGDVKEMRVAQEQLDDLNAKVNAAASPSGPGFRPPGYDHDAPNETLTPEQRIYRAVRNSLGSGDGERRGSVVQLDLSGGKFTKVVDNAIAQLAQIHTIEQVLCSALGLARGRSLTAEEEAEVEKLIEGGGDDGFFEKTVSDETEKGEGSESGGSGGKPTAEETD